MQNLFRYVGVGACALLLVVVGGVALAQQGGFDDFGGSIFDAVSIDLKVNGQDGPVTVAAGSRIVVSWISEGAARCRGNWSRNDIKSSGTVAGRISKSAVIKVACIDKEGNRDDDSVVVNVEGKVQIDSPVTTQELPNMTIDKKMVSSGESVLLKFSWPSNAVNANLNIGCPAGVTTRTTKELCNENLNVTSNRDWTLIFFNTSSVPQTVTLGYGVDIKSGSRLGVVGTITVLPEKTTSAQPTPSAVQSSFALLVSIDGPGLSLQNGYVQYEATFDGNRFDPSAVTLEISCPAGISAVRNADDAPQCSKELKMFRLYDGKYSVAVQFNNSTDSNQLVGATARFYGGDGKVLATDKDALSLPPTRKATAPLLPLPGASAQPTGDLTVTSLSWKPESPTTSILDPYVYFTAVIKNIGAGTLSIPIGTKFSIFKNGLNVGGVEVGVGYTLAAGESKTLDFTSTQLPNLRETHGIFALTFTADSFNVVIESNKNNNTITKSITITAPTTSAPTSITVDLKVNGGSGFTDGPVTVAAGTTIALSYTTTGKIAECKGDVTGYETGAVRTTVNVSRSFTVTCSQDGGTGTATDSVRVDVPEPSTAGTNTTAATPPLSATAPTISGTRTAAGDKLYPGSMSITATISNSGGALTTPVSARFQYSTNNTNWYDFQEVGPVSTTPRNVTHSWEGGVGTFSFRLCIGTGTDNCSPSSSIEIVPAAGAFIGLSRELAAAGVPDNDVWEFVKRWLGR